MSNHASAAASGHGPQEHPAHLAHHFTTSAQQYESGKLGLWIFLATEILMFGGLFCVYAVYRANHPDVFLYAHHYLDKKLGGINTAVLICSSLTMAWAVRCSQMNQRRGTLILLALTLLGGAGFMGIKSIEYSLKWKHHLWVGSGNLYHPGYKGPAAEAGEPGAGEALAAMAAHPALPVERSTVVAPATAPATSSAPADPDAPKIKLAAIGPTGLSADFWAQRVAEHNAPELPEAERRRVSIFFQIYFLMTGLHGLHVLIGMALILWVLIRAAKGEFSSAYYTPVDLVGLYWHLVDLIWIFLFPLLYLIH